MLVGAEDDIEVIGEASDGEEATALAEALVPDVILMDVRMPKRSGHRGLRRDQADGAVGARSSC